MGVSNFQERNIAIDRYAKAHNFISGFANFHQARYECDDVVFGSLLLRNTPYFKELTVFEDFSDQILTGEHISWYDNIPVFFQKIQEVAISNRYLGGFPTFISVLSPMAGWFHQWVAIKDSNETKKTEINSNDLDNPSDITSTFRAVHNYASNHGFLSGFPTFIPKDNQKVECIFLNRDDVHIGIHRDIHKNLLEFISNATFDGQIDDHMRNQLINRHAFAYNRICICSTLDSEDKQKLFDTFNKKIIHGINTDAHANASVPHGSNEIHINISNFFTLTPDEMSQTLIHEMMHIAGYEHPVKRDGVDIPNDGGPYYRSKPLQAEMCIAGQQSLALCNS